jgi:hypothetical protein
VLTPLQERIIAIFGTLPAAEGFALAGGGALIVRGLIQRETRDLDFFATQPDHVDELLPRLENALRAEGLDVERRQIGHGFGRLVVSSEDDQTVVDLASDFRLYPTEQTAQGQVLAEEELAIDKLLAVFGRAETRDFLDLAALEPRYGLERLCGLAADKDQGFDRGVLAAMMSRFHRLDRREFPLDDAEYQRLAATVDAWKQALTD